MNDAERLKRLYVVTNRASLTPRMARNFFRTIVTASGSDLLALSSAFDGPDSLAFQIAIHASSAIRNIEMADLRLVEAFIAWVPGAVFRDLGPHCEPGTLPLFWEEVCFDQPPDEHWKAFAGADTVRKEVENIRAKALWLAARLRARLAEDTYPDEAASLKGGLEQLERVIAEAERAARRDR